MFIDRKTRLIYGFIEFFVSNIFIGLITVTFYEIDKMYFNGWLLWILFIIYHLIIPLLFEGRTLFMMILGIKIKDLKTGANTSISRIIIRIIARFLYFAPILTILSLFINNNKSPLYDRISRTTLEK